jgi:hypothetical protein
MGVSVYCQISLHKPHISTCLDSQLVKLSLCAEIRCANPELTPVEIAPETIILREFCKLLLDTKWTGKQEKSGRRSVHLFSTRWLSTVCSALLLPLCICRHYYIPPTVDIQSLYFRIFIVIYSLSLFLSLFHCYILLRVRSTKEYISCYQTRHGCMAGFQPFNTRSCWIISPSRIHAKGNLNRLYNRLHNRLNTCFRRATPATQCQEAQA